MNKKSKTQIIVSLGPASGKRDVLEQLIKHNMDAVRLNMFWGSHEEYDKYISDVRELATKAGLQIPVIVDLSGPREQTSDGHHFKSDKNSIITEKDLADIAFGIEHNVEYFAMSYVGHADDVVKLREIIAEKNANTKIIAKIERAEAVKNSVEILEVADAIMIARGDLGNEVPIESIPFIQNDLIKQARNANKPVIVATEMLPSMIDQDNPTRSDVTDIAYAVISGTSAVMLSNETTTGEYPVKSVEVMERVLVEAEKHNTAQPAVLL